MWVRGLKRTLIKYAIEHFESHPMWVRGLKQSYFIPYSSIFSRTPCGCVD